MANWKEISIFDTAPKGSGLYCIYIDKKLVYIGMAGSLITRLSSHNLSSFREFGMWRSIRGQDCRLKIRPFHGTYRQLARLEAAMIGRLQPYVNKLDSGIGKREARVHRYAFDNEMAITQG